MDTHCTDRVHRPDADLRRTAPPLGPTPVSLPLQPAPATPVPPATTTRPAQPSRRPPRTARSAAEGTRRRNQRVLPSRIADLVNPQFTHRAVILKRYNVIGPSVRRRCGPAGTRPRPGPAPPIPRRPPGRPRD